MAQDDLTKTGRYAMKSLYCTQTSTGSRGSLPPFIFATLLGALCALLSACGDDELSPKSVLESYRILSVQAEPAALTLAQEVELSVFDFHPADLTSLSRPKTTYEWRLCFFSLGSLQQYECLLEEVSLADFVVFDDASESSSEEEQESEESEDNKESGEGMESEALPELALTPSSRLRLSAPELLESFGADLEAQMAQFEMGADQLGAEMDFLSSGELRLYVKLTVQVEDEPIFDAVKPISLILDATLPVNQNPELIGVNTGEESEALNIVKAGDEIKLSALWRESSAEVYTPQLSEEDKKSGVKATEQTETLLFSWYTTTGRFESPIRLSEDTETTLTIGDEPGTHRVYLSLRDGRGGVDLKAVEFKVEERSEAEE